MNTNTFTVSPMSQVIELTPGRTYHGVIRVANPADAEQDFTYVAEVAPYSVVGDDYTADLMEKSDYSIIVDWLSIDNPTGVIPPNGMTEINFRIKVPADAPGGGQYAAITVRSGATGGDGDGVMVQNVFEMASIIYAEIGGETVRDGEIVENNVPGFVTELPAKVSAKFINNGNVHEVATVTLTVKNVLTGETIFPKENDQNVYSEVIMPNTTRTLTREVGSLSGLGFYEVTQDISYMGDTATVAQTVMVCPVWFMGLVLLTVLVAIWTLFMMVRRRQKRRRVF